MIDSASEQGLARFDHAIVGDDGRRTLKRDGNRFDADDLVRVTETEMAALEDCDRVVTRGATGQKLIIEKIPDDLNRPTPIEIRDCEGMRDE